MWEPLWKITYCWSSAQVPSFNISTELETPTVLMILLVKQSLGLSSHASKPSIPERINLYPQQQEQKEDSATVISVLIETNLHAEAERAKQAFSTPCSPLMYPCSISAAQPFTLRPSPHEAAKVWTFTSACLQRQGRPEALPRSKMQL